MICVYPAKYTDFSTNGNGTLAPLLAEATETLNGEYKLTVVHQSIKPEMAAVCGGLYPPSFRYWTP